MNYSLLPRIFCVWFSTNLAIRFVLAADETNLERAALVLELQNQECTNLLPGQYKCTDKTVNTTTQQLEGCQPVHPSNLSKALAKVRCEAAPGIKCRGMGINGTFYKDVPCKYTNGYSFELSLAFSILLGMFGVDRFYLGYPGIGILKLCTFGGFFLLQLVDIILIASGALGPADGSHFVIPFYGPGLQRLTFTHNHTYLRPPQDL